jgi:tRNA (guanine37-N1)-methyltransferase
MKPFSAIALTLFPDMFPGPLGQSLAGTALKNKLWSLEAIDIRSFATDKHRTVDDSPYGGGVGMVLKPDIVDTAIEHAKTRLPNAKILYTSPRGMPFNQALATEFKNHDLIIVCGRFEGLDQRVIDHHQMIEVSLGDFVLSGGEIAALAILDACVRLIPGVIGKEDAINEESFAITSDYAGLLEYPHYTRPPLWKGVGVPEVLLSGNHREINNWRLAKAEEITAKRRPDLMKKKD